MLISQVKEWGEALMTRISFYEQETLISFNREEALAEVYTHEPRLIKRLQALSCKFPDTFKLTRIHSNDGFSFELPKKLISIRAPTSEKRRREMREQGLRIGYGPHAKTGQ